MKMPPRAFDTSKWVTVIFSPASFQACVAFQSMDSVSFEIEWRPSKRGMARSALLLEELLLPQCTTFRSADIAKGLIMFARKAIHYFGRALRETGQALDRVGLRVAENEIFRDTFTRHRTQMVMNDKRPIVALDCFVAPNATLIGDILMLTEASVWYGAVLRGERNKITVGGFTNIQDKVVIDCTAELETGFPAEVEIGNHVTVGHGAVLRSCVIQDRCIVGMNAMISEGCVLERTSMVAAGSVLLPHTLVPSGQLWAGNPAVYIRDLKYEEIESIEKSAMSYVALAQQHNAEFLPFGTAYQEAERVGAA